MSIVTVRCQSSSLPLPKHRGKEKPAGTAMPAGFPLSGEILVTHGSANASSKSQARALVKCEIIPARGLPCAIPAETRAAQRASRCGISASACQARPLRRGLRSRTG
jgi:hypothetical protein